ncbi:MAG TPA: hypothetical protein V6D03_15885 [Candidatus Caenarcaniphilales bacterium]
MLITHSYVPNYRHHPKLKQQNDPANLPLKLFTLNSCPYMVGVQQDY